MEYYTYAYLRKDKTPYYIGKGKGRRAYLCRRECINPPQDKTLILIGYQSTAAGVVAHNKFIGADPKARVRIS